MNTGGVPFGVPRLRGAGPAEAGTPSADQADGFSNGKLSGAPLEKTAQPDAPGLTHATAEYFHSPNSNLTQNIPWPKSDPQSSSENSTPSPTKRSKARPSFARCAAIRMWNFVHWIHQLVQSPDTDLAAHHQAFRIDASRLATDLQARLDKLAARRDGISGFSPQIQRRSRSGLVYGTLLFGEWQVRTGHIVVALLKTLAAPYSPRALAGVRQDQGGHALG